MSPLYGTKISSDSRFDPATDALAVGVPGQALEPVAIHGTKKIYCYWKSRGVSDHGIDSALWTKGRRTAFTVDLVIDPIENLVGHKYFQAIEATANLRTFNFRNVIRAVAVGVDYCGHGKFAEECIDGWRLFNRPLLGANILSAFR
jgi:hypothetical protein